MTRTLCPLRRSRLSSVISAWRSVKCSPVATSPKRNGLQVPSSEFRSSTMLLAFCYKATEFRKPTRSSAKCQGPMSLAWLHTGEDGLDRLTVGDCGADPPRRPAHVSRAPALPVHVSGSCEANTLVCRRRSQAGVELAGKQDELSFRAGTGYGAEHVAELIENGESDWSAKPP